METMVPILLKGLWVSLKLFFFALLFALPLALPVALGRMSRRKCWKIPLNWPIRLYLLIMRGTPLMLQLMVVYFGPTFAFGWKWPDIGAMEGRFVAAIVAFSLNYAAYFAEIYRGGMESIPAGQYEAGQVLGMTRPQTFFRIILPQVVKRILPACGNEFMTLVKDTALAMTIAVSDLMRKAETIASRETSVMPFLVAGLFYLVVNLVVEQGFHLAERKLDYYR